MTNRCPLRCKMCNIPDNQKDREELTLEELKRVVDEIVEWNDNEKYVSFVGGEALVRMEDTLEMIRYCRERDLHTTLVTSGVLFEEETPQRLLDSGLDRIAFSLDGAQPSTHNKIRGKKVYGKVIDSIDSMLGLRSDDEIKIDINTVIMSYNFEELPGIHEIVRSKGLDEIFYQAVVPDNTYREKDGLYDNDLWINEDRIPRLKEIMGKLIELKNRYGIINNSKRYFELVPKYFERKQDFKPGKCLAGYMGLNIDPYGDISICGFGPNINVKDDSIENLWKSKEFKETRKRIKNCERPCMMLCYRKARLIDLFENFVD
ncbi:MAG: radical SAM/SPASM domain-containing protein [Candidatus Aenigmatarchaeota archaeon]